MNVTKIERRNAENIRFDAYPTADGSKRSKLFDNEEWKSRFSSEKFTHHPLPLFAQTGNVQSISKLKFVPGSQKYSGNQLYEATLSESQNVQGVTLPKYSIVGFSNGRLWSVYFPVDTTLGGITWHALPSNAGNDRYRYSVGLYNGRPTRGVLATQSTLILGSGRSARGITLPSNTEVELNVNGSVRNVVAPSSVTAQGLTLLGGVPHPFLGTWTKPSIIFYDNGNICSAILGNDATFNGITFPKVTEIHLDEKGRLISTYLPQDQVIKGITFAGNTYNGNPSKHYNQVGVSFYPDGKLKGGHLAFDQMIQGIPAEKVKWIDWGFSDHMTEVSFHKNGNLKSTYLSRNFTYQGIACGNGTKLTIYPNGKIKSASLASDQIIQGIKYRQGARFGIVAPPNIEFHDNGKLASAVPAQDTIIQGIPCKGNIGNEVTFYKSGKLASAILSKAVTLNGVNCPAGESIELYENGNLKAVGIANDATIQGIPCKKDAAVEFHENGKLKKATLSTPKTINGLLCPQGKQIELLKNGDLKWDCR